MIELPSHPSRVGLSDDAWLVACTIAALKGLGMYSSDQLRKACIANGINEEQMTLAARELIAAEGVRLKPQESQQ
jgi:hypothetical protein